jgi:predicted ArsR family transcriptional regulator
MNATLIDNPTRERILLSLKKKGSLSVDDLSREVKITPMGVRQHLLILERNGVVEYITKKHGVGRPGFLYRLTERADDLFPKAYQGFAMDILIDIENHDGRDKIDGIFKRRKERIASEMMRMLSGKEGLADRIQALYEILQDKGFVAELEEDTTFHRLNIYNCPISKIAVRFKEACKYDLELFKTIIGEDVQREHCLSNGGNACAYTIPKK